MRCNASRKPPNAQLSAAPLATSTDRHERWHATTPQNRAQLRGRASGVRCKALLGIRPYKIDKNISFNEFFSVLISIFST